jgi:hypothetical protein
MVQVAVVVVDRAGCRDIWCYFGFLGVLEREPVAFRREHPA